jgi:hypothetical protein
LVEDFLPDSKAPRMQTKNSCSMRRGGEYGKELNDSGLHAGNPVEPLRTSRDRAMAAHLDFPSAVPATAVDHGSIFPRTPTRGINGALGEEIVVSACVFIHPQ